MSEDKQPTITGKQHDPEKDNKQQLTREDIMFETDEDGIAIPQTVDIEIYNKVLDDEIMLTTMELDNCLTMFESTDKAFKMTKKHIDLEIDKLHNRVDNLNKEDCKVKNKEEELRKTEKELSDKSAARDKFCFENEAKLTAFKDHANECRKDITFMENQISQTKNIKTVEMKPCNDSEAYKYFAKRMWKDDKGGWIKPIDKDDMSYISYMLNELVDVPNLSVKEWDMAKPDFKKSIHDKLQEISFYRKLSPKEILIEKRRNEKIKNILGETQEGTN